MGEILSESVLRGALRQLSRQRVALVLQPGNIWVIDNTGEDNEQIDAALKTCFMRGWVEPIHNAVPTGKLEKNGKLPSGSILETVSPLYRMTESGWSVLNRTHAWSLFAVVVSILSFVVSVGSLLVAVKSLHN